MRISDWSSDVCSSDLHDRGTSARINKQPRRPAIKQRVRRREHSLINTRERKRESQRSALLEAVRLAEDEPSAERHVGSEIGRASCRERVCQYVKISVVAV